MGNFPTSQREDSLKLKEQEKKRLEELWQRDMHYLECIEYLRRKNLYEKKQKQILETQQKAQSVETQQKQQRKKKKKKKYYSSDDESDDESSSSGMRHSNRELRIANAHHQISMDNSMSSSCMSEADSGFGF